MKLTRFSVVRIIKNLKEYDAVKEIKDICRDHGIFRATFYSW